MSERFGRLSRCLLLAAAFFLPSPAQAQQCLGVTGPVRAFTQEAITVSSTAIGITSTIFTDIAAQGKQALFATFTLESNPIRHRFDGVAPTATVGNLVNNSAGGNVTFTICGETSVKLFRAIRTGSDAAMTAIVFVSQ